MERWKGCLSCKLMPAFPQGREASGEHFEIGDGIRRIERTARITRFWRTAVSPHRCQHLRPAAVLISACVKGSSDACPQLEVYGYSLGFSGQASEEPLTWPAGRRLLNGRQLHAQS